MVRKDRSNIAVPATLLSKACKQSLEFILTHMLGNDEEIKQAKESIGSKFYRGYQINENGDIEQDVAESLKDLYNFKCAFCESKRHYPDVDHYRPKKRVTGVSGHLGYYWLCYEWTNLLPVCDDCNAIKLTSFPLKDESKRVYGPTYKLDKSLNVNGNLCNASPLTNEEAILIHPEYDNPQAFFSFDVNGAMLGIDQEGRGEATLKICGLNRKDLLWFRQKEINTTTSFFQMSLYFDDEYYFLEVLSKVRERALDPEEEYTLLYKNIYNDFSNIILPLLPLQRQAIAQEIYENNVNLL